MAKFERILNYNYVSDVADLSLQNACATYTAPKCAMPLSGTGSMYTARVLTIFY